MQVSAIEVALLHTIFRLIPKSVTLNGVMAVILRDHNECVTNET